MKKNHPHQKTSVDKQMRQIKQRHNKLLAQM